jgi:DNA replication protein DnaC
MKTMNGLVNNALETLTKPQKTLAKECAECSNLFDVADDVFARYMRICPSCQSKADEKQRSADIQRRSQERAAKWLTICPPEFRKLDPARLPNPKKLVEVMAWCFGPRGLILHGDTGRGKTRCAWALLAREHEAGRNIAIMDSMAGLEYASLYNQSAYEVKKWTARLIKTDILLFDDVFKSKLSDSFENELFTLLDQRIAWHRPCILTTNDVGETLASRMTPDRGNPFLRRLREHCQSIQF